MAEIEVSDLPDGINDYSLFCITKRFGKTSAIRVQNNKAVISFRRRSKAIAFYDFISKNCPRVCVKLLEEKTELFVDRIPKETTLESLKLFFQKYGELVKIEQERTYFEFQTLKLIFSSAGDAKKCLLKTNKKEYLKSGEKLVVKYYDETRLASIKTKNNDNLCVFVYNVPTGMSYNAFNKIFSCYGDIKSLEILENSMGFVNYDNELSALKAVKYADRLEIMGQKLSVILKSEKTKTGKYLHSHAKDNDY